MNDQFQNSQSPTLSLEEELDVLEAVYKIGKEKGLELLRPEQVRQLIDAGRVSDGSNEKPMVDSSEEDLNTDLVLESFRVVEGIVRSTEKYYKNYYSDDQWNAFSDEEKYQAMKEMFASLVRVNPEALGYSIYSQLLRKSYAA